MSRALQLQLVALTDFPLVAAGDDLAALTVGALQRQQLQLSNDDVVVYAQKVVSKAEGRMIDMRSVTPGERALELAKRTGKDARLVELVLQESSRVVRAAQDVLIVEHKRGMIMANAGIDQSNVSASGSQGWALLLPEDPDASAARLRARLNDLSGFGPGVIISDSFGRPWRVGTVGVAIGCAGVASTLDLRGHTDLFGRPLRVTVVGHADEIASAASILMGQAAEGLPVVVIRGLNRTDHPTPASALLRPSHEDLFK